MTAQGFGKRSDFKEYRTQSRGGKGIINIKVTPRNGKVLAAVAVMPKDEIMTVTKNGMVVRCSLKEIRQTARASQGVRLMSLSKGDEVTSIANAVSRSEEG